MQSLVSPAPLASHACSADTVYRGAHTRRERRAGIPPEKSDASGGIGPKHIVTLTSGGSARCHPMRPIFPVKFQLQL